MTPPRILLACAVGALVLVPACGDDEQASDTTATTTTVVTSTSTTSASTSSSTTGDGTSTSTSAPASGPAISVSVYWTRPHGTARPIDVPAYQDLPGGPYPYVLYGSVTNVGDAPLESSVVDVTWVLDGETVHRGVGELYDAEGIVVDALAPGVSAELVVVVDDEAVAARLPDAVPTFEVPRP